MKVLDPKISNLNLNLGKTLKEDQEVSVILNAHITFSKENQDNYLVTEILDMFSAEKNKIFSVEVACPLTFESNDVKDTAQRNEIIKNDVFPMLYNKIKTVSDYLLSNATVVLPPLPERFN